MRVQINLSDSMVKRVDVMADDMGVTRSAFCSFVIGQYVQNYEKSIETLKSVGLQLANSQNDGQ